MVSILAARGVLNAAVRRRLPSLPTWVCMQVTSGRLVVSPTQVAIMSRITLSALSVSNPVRASQRVTKSVVRSLRLRNGYTADPSSRITLKDNLASRIAVCTL